MERIAQLLAFMRSRSGGALMGAADFSCAVAGFLLATFIRFELQPPREYLTRSVLFSLGFAAVVVFVGRAAGLYRGVVRFGSYEELVYMTGTVGGVTILATVVTLVTPRHPVPISILLVGTGIAFVFMCGFRATARGLRELRLVNANRGGSMTLIAGAGEGGAVVIRDILRNPAWDIRPVGLLDDDRQKRHLRIQGVPVLGTLDQMERVARSTGASELVVAIPSAGPELVRECAERATRAGLHLKVLPSVASLIGAELGGADIRELSVEDLFGRKEVEIDLEAASAYIAGKTVLVTGAGGSIGAELCRQIQGLNPRRVLVLDHDESNLHRLQLELRNYAIYEQPELIVADVRDELRIQRLMSSIRPHVVFHAAAHKHLPLLELHPCEGVKSNVAGTYYVAKAASEFDIEHFINISTDKAANPTSVLGATKRLAELVVKEIGHQSTGRFSSVRFGNVFGSRGSVVETFESQIASGGPITVSHPDVTRFFMSIREAARLVIQAGATTSHGEVFVLDMGEPVKIRDLADQMIAISGKRDIPIRYTGLRPGEKLHEELFNDSEVSTVSTHVKIFRVQDGEAESPPVLERAETLIRAAWDEEEDKARWLLEELIAGYHYAGKPGVALGAIYPDGY